MTHEADILGDGGWLCAPDLLSLLLKDHTLSSPVEQANIFWATDDYAHLGRGYAYHDPITPDLITGMHGDLIKPRTSKHRQLQESRSKDMAEVFTPAWVCNAQNNLVDEAWFGRADVFNRPTTREDGTHTWLTTPDKIVFPEGKTWKDYVRANRLEITCGEAPYLVSRYDASTGVPIPLADRIGLLDRKLRVVSENTTTSTEWLAMAQEAYKSVYAYEWQGDSLLLARQALLATFVEYYRAKFGKKPLDKSVRYVAYIISWNVWQMDGLRGVVPDSCHDNRVVATSLFGDNEVVTSPCAGCQKDDMRLHNGKYCLVKDWGATDPITGKRGRRIRFIDLIQPS